MSAGTAPDPGRAVVAAVQAAPVFLDRDAAVAKACSLIAEAAKHGTSLAGYPDWVWRTPAWHDSDFASRLATSAVEVGSPATDALAKAAADAGVYVIGVAPLLHGGDVPAELRGELYSDSGDWMSRGHTAIVAPGGDVLAGPVTERTEILYAETDLAAVRASRREFDPVGHYARPDVFTLTVDARPEGVGRIP